MSNKKLNKQNNKKQQKLNNKKHLIISFGSLIILLLLILIIILVFNTKNKSDKSIIKEFNTYYESNNRSVIFYYDSDDSKKEYELDIEYLTQLKRDYDIEVLFINKKELTEKHIKDIEYKLGIKNTLPVISVVSNKQIIGAYEGIIESHNLVNLLINTNVLDKDSKYKDIDNINFIGYKEYKEIFDNNDTNIVVIGRAGCKYCAAVKPILNNIGKAYKVDINYLDINDIDKEDLKELFEQLPEKGYDNNKLKDEGVFSMPTLLIIKKGKITSYIENQQSLEDYIKYLKDNDVIE